MRLNACVPLAIAMWALCKRCATRTTALVFASLTLPERGAASVRPDSTTFPTACRATVIRTAHWTPRAPSMAINRNASAKWAEVEPNATNALLATLNIPTVLNASATRPAPLADRAIPTPANATANPTFKESNAPIAPLTFTTTRFANDANVTHSALRPRFLAAQKT